MRTTMVWKISAIGTVLAASLALATPSAMAAPATPDGVASLGNANIVEADGTSDSISPLAICDLNGQATDSSTGGSIDDMVSYGKGTTSCTKDTAANTTTATAKGSRFVLDALMPYGGPEIKLNGYQVTCTANTAGTNASWSFSGLTGLSGLPQQIPSNYTKPITGTGGKVVANAIVNEVILPDPNDGSITLNLIHFKLFPNGDGPISGDIYVGSTACTPTVA